MVMHQPDHGKRHRRLGLLGWRRGDAQTQKSAEEGNVVVHTWLPANQNSSGNAILKPVRISGGNQKQPASQASFLSVFVHKEDGRNQNKPPREFSFEIPPVSVQIPN
jgi:hypothetical protein